MSGNIRKLYIEDVQSSNILNIKSVTNSGIYPSFFFAFQI